MFQEPYDLISAFFDNAPCSMVGIDVATKLVIVKDMPKKGRKRFNLDDMTDQPNAADIREDFSERQIVGFNNQFTLPEDMSEIEIFVRGNEPVEAWRLIKDKLLGETADKEGAVIGQAYRGNLSVIVELIFDFQGEFEAAPQEEVEKLIDNRQLDVAGMGEDGSKFPS